MLDQQKQQRHGARGSRERSDPWSRCEFMAKWVLAGVCVAAVAQLEEVAQLWRCLRYGGYASTIASSSKEAGVIAIALILIILYLLRLLFFRHRHVYLVDLTCYRPPPLLRAPHSTFLEHSKLSGIFDDHSLEFQKKILERSGLGQNTSFPLCFRHLPPNPSMEAARQEAESVLCSCTEGLLRKTNVCSKDIAVVVVNCSTFSPSPSLCSVIVNQFKLRSNVKTYNLAGMGCSAGVIAIALARDALQYSGSTTAYALVLSTENITQNWYWGKNRTMLVSNCLFRVGGAAMLLAKGGAATSDAKYRLDHVVRTHTGGEDAAYGAAYQREDEEGQVGVFLSKELMRIAATALSANARRLAPMVLPYTEIARFVVDYVCRRWADGRRIWTESASNGRRFLAAAAPRKDGQCSSESVDCRLNGKSAADERLSSANASEDGRRSPFVPDFTKAFDHFLIHSGGRAVLAAVEAGLRLGPAQMEPSRMALHRFGNTSVSTTWYQLQYLESSGKVKKGDRVWQIAFGSGFKCNSAVWTAMKTVSDFDSSNAWSDCILDYPVPLSDTQII